MSLPIAPTPILKGKEANDFLRNLLKNEKKPAYLVPTPKLERALNLIRNMNPVYK
ncbi:hypothetical protein LCGC14_1556000 [marine sediment metagenome]|uniref:Uncharacterized protein n=1 Tax=marine sediment metagenome TaxID=412755 RepID=A0A0F9L564_9ZZZZ